MRIALALAGLLAAAGADAASARSGLVLVSTGNHYVVMRVGGPRPQEVLRLGRSVSYGESADAFVFVTDRIPQVGSWVVEIVDKRTLAVIWSHSVIGTPVKMLQGTVKDVVLTARAVYFVTGRYGEHPSDLNALGGLFDLNVLSRADGRQDLMPLPRLMGLSLSEDGGVLVLRQQGGADWRLNEAGALEAIEDTHGLPDLERGHSEGTRQTFRTVYRGTPVIGVVRGYSGAQARWTLAYVDPAKKTELWEKPLPDSVQPESVFVGPDGWNYYIDTHSGAVSGISDEPGTRELWKLSTAYLSDAYILQIDAE